MWKFNNLRLQGIAWLVGISLLFAIGFFLNANRVMFTVNPFHKELALEYPAIVTFDNRGNLYLADQSMMRILKMNAAWQIEFSLYGGRSSAENFYQCQFIAADEQEFVYVVDNVPSDSGMYINTERIIRFRPDGKFDRELATFDYSSLPLEERPMLNGWICGLQIIDGKLYYLYIGNHDLLLCRVDAAGITAIKAFPCTDARLYVLSGAIAADLQSVYYVTKRGEIVKNSGDEQRICYQGFGDNQTLAATSVPNSIRVDPQGNVFFSDRGSYSCIKKIGTDGMVSVVIGEPNGYGSARAEINTTYNEIGLSPDGRYLAATDKYFVVSTTDAIKTDFVKFDKVTLSLVALLERLGMWLILLVWVVAVFYILWRVLLLLVRKKWSQTVRYVIIVLGIAFSVCVVVGIVFSVHFYSILSKELSGQITATAATVGQTIDGDAVRKIRYLSDYGSNDMENVRRQMTNITRNFYQDEANLYYALYQTNGRDVYQILARADNIGAMDTMNNFYEGSYYQAVWQSGKPKTFENSKSSIGIWTYAIAPVYAGDGTITGLVEVGVDAKRLLEEQQRLFFLISGGVLSGVVILIICFTKGFYLLKLLRNRWQKKF